MLFGRRDDDVFFLFGFGERVVEQLVFRRGEQHELVVVDLLRVVLRLDGHDPLGAVVSDGRHDGDVDDGALGVPGADPRHVVL